MSFIDDQFSSIGISFTDEDKDLKKKFLECLCGTYEEDENIFSGIYGVPDELQKYAEMRFLCASYIHIERINDLFLLLNKLFPATTVFLADDWDMDDTLPDFFGLEDEDEDYDEWDDEDEESEVNGEKDLVFFDPEEMTESSYVLSWHEVLDMGGGSNGADIDFKSDAEPEIEEITETDLNRDFAVEILKAAEEKRYQDLAEMIDAVLE